MCFGQGQGEASLSGWIGAPLSPNVPMYVACAPPMPTFTLCNRKRLSHVEPPTLFNVWQARAAPPTHCAPAA